MNINTSKYKIFWRKIISPYQTIYLISKILIFALSKPITMSIIYSLSLYLPCFVSLSWALLLFCNRKRNTRSQNIWMASMLVMGICAFIWIMLFGGIDDYYLYYKLDIIDITCTLLLFPLFCLYFRALTRKEKITWKEHLWLLPAFIIGGASAIIYLLLGEEQSADYIRRLIESHDSFQFPAGSLQWLLHFISLEIFYAVFIIQIIATMAYSTRNVIRYRKGLHNFFSNLDGKSVENNRAVLTGLYILLAIAITASLVWRISHESYYFIRYILMAATGLCLYYMSFYVYKIRFTAENLLLDDPAPSANNETTTAERNADSYIIKLLPLFNKLIDEEKIFLQPDLSLDNIAAKLNSNRTYISHLINDEFNCNFYEFINRKRIEYAKSLIIQNPNYTQEQIAHMSGFTHASTFSLSFKKQSGTTFKEWRKRIN